MRKWRSTQTPHRLWPIFEDHYQYHTFNDRHHNTEAHDYNIAANDSEYSFYDINGKSFHWKRDNDFKVTTPLITIQTTTSTTTNTLTTNNTTPELTTSPPQNTTSGKTTNSISFSTTLFTTTTNTFPWDDWRVLAALAMLIVFGLIIVVLIIIFCCVFCPILMAHKHHQNNDEESEGINFSFVLRKHSLIDWFVWMIASEAESVNVHQLLEDGFVHLCYVLKCN